jgi:tetratricopeptide (TPR) repeat protein
MRKNLAFLGFLVLLHPTTAFGAVLGVESPAQVLLVEESSEALCTWYQEGVRGFPLVQFGVHPAFYSAKFNLDKDAVSLREALKVKDCRSILPRVSGAVRKDSLWSVEDFAYAAYLLGVSGELWWVIPSNDGLTEENYEQFRKWLRDDLSFPEDFVRGLVLQGGIVRGVFKGLHVRFVTFGDLPSIEGPVLLSVEATFIHRLYVNPVRKGMVDILGRFFALLGEKKLEGERVAVAVGGGTPLIFRYLGERLRDLLAEPGRFDQGPPEAWRLQGEFEYLDFMLARDDAVAAAARLAGLEPRSPLPWYDRAVIAALREDAAEAERMLHEAKRRDPSYQAGYRALAKILAGQGMQEEAFALVEKGNRDNPADYDTAILLAENLLARGDYERCLSVIAPLIEEGPTLPAPHLYRARALWMMGEEDAARQAMARFRDTAPPGAWREGLIGDWARMTGSSPPASRPADP